MHSTAERNISFTQPKYCDSLSPNHSSHPDCVISRLVTLLKFIDAPIQFSDNLEVTLIFKLINFSFRISLFFPEFSAKFTSYVVQIIYFTLVWIM